ncbi:DnaJ C terminal domain-containing protein [Rhizobium mongolense subsp. loessense]|uniref:DnaJ C terminal domain-containing protein n=1 Tax=Rhizobium mongolense subsp. loessense TaxID=158890 RepID=A0A1G4PHN5_9HYPH|nr:DnaJ C-terminal domain-containing protein [Rhizobium mongolense]SCW31787.1 DnaJ C terminal domain-containing protein [Rhizobium mongolense subsp. loessense]
MRDPYKILGVPQDAGTDEIKAAWRNMAKAVHPDHNQGDPTATARFAEVGRAYETLKDPKKRSLFDTAARMAEARMNGETIMQQRQAAREAAVRAKAAQANAERVMEELARANAQKAAKAARQQHVSPESAEDMVERIFGAQAKAASASATPPRANAGKRTEAEAGKLEAEAVKPEEEGTETVAAAGILQPLSILTSLVRRFTGSAPAPEKAPDQFVQVTVTIEDILKGSWTTAQLGEGREASFALSAGTREGHQVRLKGHGYKLPNMQRGDAVVSIHIASDARFTVDGFDLRTVLPVTIENAVLGTEARIDGPNGPVDVTVPAWSGSDKTIRISGQGLPDDTGGKGDLIVELRIMLWEKPDDKVTDLMRSMREGLFL